MELTIVIIEICVILSYSKRPGSYESLKSTDEPSTLDDFVVYSVSAIVGDRLLSPKHDNHTKITYPVSINTPRVEPRSKDTVFDNFMILWEFHHQPAAFVKTLKPLDFHCISEATNIQFIGGFAIPQPLPPKPSDNNASKYALVSLSITITEPYDPGPSKSLITITSKYLEDYTDIDLYFFTESKQLKVLVLRIEWSRLKVFIYLNVSLFDDDLSYVWCLKADVHPNEQDEAYIS
jgi:hypothetical protein